MREKLAVLFALSFAVVTATGCASNSPHQNSATDTDIEKNGGTDVLAVKKFLLDNNVRGVWRGKFPREPKKFLYGPLYIAVEVHRATYLWGGRVKLTYFLHGNWERMWVIHDPEQYRKFKYTVFLTPQAPNVWTGKKKNGAEWKFAVAPGGETMEVTWKPSGWLTWETTLHKTDLAELPESLVP